MPASAPRPIVIYRLGSLGDTIVALPCFHAIAQAHPDARKLVLTNIPVSSKAAPLEGILGHSGLMDGTLAYPVGTRSVRALWSLARELRALDADTLYYLTPARGLLAAWRDWVYFRLCGFRRIVGIPLTPALQTNQNVGPNGHLEHEALRLARCLAPMGRVDVHNRRAWDLHLQPPELEAGARCVAPLSGRPVLAINMGGKVAINDWGEDHWRALLDRLASTRPDWGLLIVGGQEDVSRAAAMAAHWPGPVAQACGTLSPRASAAALGHADLFIGHDSGPMHLAAAMGVPCIGLFGPNNPPGKWHPFGSSHLALHDMRGVRSISVQTVLDAALARMAARPEHHAVMGR